MPRPFIPSVLQLAHSHQLGAHPGVEKTLERIKARFYWPGVKKAGEDFCRSCPECQQVAPRPHLCSPLIPLPIISIPFSRIGMDLVGPLPKSARGYQYILVILDYATRYPEAIPLRTMASKGIARELVMLFSRVRIPEEILTDQGTPFMSRIMKDLCKLMNITQLRTSVYHSQTDGLVERFNQTLKQMLKKVMEADGRLLPYLMFSIREVPHRLLPVQATLWETTQGTIGPRQGGLGATALSPSDPGGTCGRGAGAHGHPLAPGKRTHGGRTGCPRPRLQPGDRVLVLVPTMECKFLAKWHGPYEVIEKVVEVNYRIRQPGRRPPEKVYHVNLLKKWVARDVLCSFPPPQGPAKMEPVEVPIGEQLSKSQRQDVTELVERHRDVFSTEAGRTALIQHHIITEPGKKVKLRPYRIPEARREAVRQELFLSGRSSHQVLRLRFRELWRPVSSNRTYRSYDTLPSSAVLHQLPTCQTLHPCENLPVLPVPTPKLTSLCFLPRTGVVVPVQFQSSRSESPTYLFSPVPVWNNPFLSPVPEWTSRSSSSPVQV
ncbi:hypothetical protein SKAU_G00056260 [Synaphobranchus kaupii]|uniref:Gypsy retrotransposon integrase-like protein 1 n=1 Tax=Synaphobranchus kaupii TaxID=118154 RepID=A0A9Q1J954_SYNKA|nr:hypothetical protein SKAU_G00056260 [Synaphobranchus kaupii]